MYYIFYVHLVYTFIYIYCVYVYIPSWTERGSTKYTSRNNMFRSVTPNTAKSGGTYAVPYM